MQCRSLARSHLHPKSSIPLVLCPGIDLVISAVGHQQDALESQYLLLRAAKRARVKRFIPSNFGLDLNRIP